MTPKLELSPSFQEDGIAILTIAGEIDAETSFELEDAIENLLFDGKSRLVLDFSQVDFLASAGLRVLLSAQQQAKKLGGQVRLCGMSRHVSKVIEMVGFNRMFIITDTCQEALQEDW